MALKKRMYTRKRIFEDMHNEGTSDIQQTTSFQDLQDNLPCELQQFGGTIRNRRRPAKKRVSKRAAFFADLEDEGTSKDLQSLDDEQFGAETVRDIIAENEVRNPIAVGQASYQKTIEGVVILYKDDGDDEFQCVHCDAYFWLDEANQRTSKTAPIIYTGCCQKGQVELPKSAKSPDFLEQLLNPNSGRENLIFRDNIRVYNSMFAFTSMGAKIDKNVNDGSGPYVFKYVDKCII